MRVEQEIGRHHDGGQHIVEIVRNATGQLTDQLHLLLLGNLVLKLALRRGFERIDNSCFLIALGFFDGRHVEAPETLIPSRQGRIDRRDVALALSRLPNSGFECRPIPLGDDAPDGAIGILAVDPACTVKQPGKQWIGTNDTALPVDGRDRHRGVMEETHEAYFRHPLWVGAVIACAIDDQRSRRAGLAIGTKGKLVKQPHRQRASAPGTQIEIEHLGLYRAWRGLQCRQQCCAVACDEIGELQAPRANLS